MASIPRRRNGRQQACQPCSKRKVACDHRLPICSRCQRSRCPEKCVYAPERRSAPGRAPSSASSPSAPSVRVLDLQNRTPEDLVTEDSVTHQRKWGYLGDTNFSAVFHEASASLGDLGESPDVLVAPNADPELDHPFTALDVLRCIPKRMASYTLFQHAPLHNTWCVPAVARMLDSFWATFARQLEEGDLLAVAEKLNKGTAQVWKETESDPEEWVSAFLDDRFRWETLGVLFIYWASGASRAKAHDDGNVSRERQSQQYGVCAWQCTEISRRAYSCNTLVLWVLFRCIISESGRSGDGSMETWRLHSDVVALSTYMGLHASPGPLKDQSISVQMRRRMYANVYKMDKALAVFAGRPPLLQQKYCSTPLPLDVSDEELWSRGFSRLDTTDSNGWGTKGDIMRITGSRARAMLAMVAENILEVALQPSRDDVVPQLLTLKEKATNTYCSFPAVLTHTHDSTMGAPQDTYYRLLVKLEHLQNLFITERLLRRQGYPESAQNLLRVSYDMVALTLEFWGNHSLFMYIRGDLEWLVTQFAAPGGGILCAELLQPRTDGVVKRSEIVQKLGLLTELLKGIKPDAPNGGMCCSVRMILTSVLDKALNGEERREADPGVVVTGVEDWGFDFEQLMNGGDAFESDFLDTFHVKELVFTSL